MLSGPKPKPALFIDIDEDNSKGIIRHLIEGADLAEVFEGKTAMEYAATTGRWNCVRTIANNRKSDADDTYRYGNAIFEVIKYATTADAKYLLPLLVKSGADIMVKNAEGVPLFKYATSHWLEDGGTIAQAKKELGELKPELLEILRDRLVEVIKFPPMSDDTHRVVETIIKLGVPLNYTYSNPEDKNNSLLHYAVILKDRKLLELMLENGSGDLAGQNTDHQTPIELAASLGLWDLVQLIAEKKKTDDKDTFHYGKVLFTIIDKPNSDEIGHLPAILVRAGADLTLKNSEGVKAIERAGMLSKIQIAIPIAKAKQESGELSKEIKESLGSPLVNALHNEKFELALTLINLGATFTFYVLPTKNTPLHYAVLKKQMSLLKLMLEKDYANLDCQNAAHETPIELAAKEGLWDYVIAIAETKKTDAKDSYHYGQVLFMAMQAGRPVTEIETLIKAGADLTLQNIDKKTAIQVAARAHNWAYVQAISNNKKADGKDIKDGSALRLAVANNHSETVKILLKNGADVNASRDHGTHNYCLHLAVVNNNPQMIADLLNAKDADPTVTNKAGQTPLALACAEGKWECAKALTKKPCTFKDKASAGQAFLKAIAARQLDVAIYLYASGASITEKDAYGDSALHIAIKNNDTAAIEYLLGIGADQTAFNKFDQTPIEFACWIDKGLCVTTLLQFGKNNKDDKKHIQDLHYEKSLLLALQNRRYGLAISLLEHNAPCDKQSAEYGNQALRTAFSPHPSYWESYVEILDALIQHGANPHDRDSKGNNFYDFLRHNRDKKTLDWLKEHYPENKLADGRAKETAEKIFKSLLENSILAKDIPASIASLEQSLKQMLANDLEKLKIRRYKNEKNPDLLVDTESEKINTAIAAINSLLNFPEKEINFSYSDFEEAKDIQRYLSWSKDIAKYVADIKEFLNALKVNIHTGNWFIEDFFGDLINDYPTHVRTMKKKLESLNVTSSTQDYLQVYSDIHKILLNMPANKRRAQSTQLFYEQQKKKIGLVTFSTSDLAYRSYDVHPHAEKPIIMAPVELLPGLAPSVSTTIQSSEVVSEFASRLMPHLYPSLTVEALPSLEPLPTPVLETPTLVNSDQAVLYPDIKTETLIEAEPGPRTDYELIAADLDTTCADPTAWELKVEAEVTQPLMKDSETKENPLDVDAAKNAEQTFRENIDKLRAVAEPKKEEVDIDAELASLPKVIEGSPKIPVKHTSLFAKKEEGKEEEKQEKKKETSEPKRVALLA